MIARCLQLAQSSTAVVSGSAEPNDAGSMPAAMAAFQMKAKNENAVCLGRPLKMLGLSKLTL